MSILKLDQHEVEVLAEWCRNKPEEAAAEILALKADRNKSKSSSGTYCQCGRWIPDHAS